MKVVEEDVDAESREAEREDHAARRNGYAEAIADE